MLLPGQASYHYEIVNSPLGDIEEHLFSWRGHNLELDASYSDLPGIAVMFGGYKKIFREAKKALLEAAKGEIRDFRITKWGPYFAAEMDFKVLNSSRVPSQLGQARFYLVQKRLYVLVATTDHSKPDLASIQTFFDSFRLEPKKKRS